MNDLAQVIQFPSRGYDPELTKRQVAEMFNCSTRTIERYCDEAYTQSRGWEPLPHFRTLGGDLRFVLSQVERWRKAVA
jgi:hypothetical protein